MNPRVFCIAQFVHGAKATGFPIAKNRGRAVVSGGTVYGDIPTTSQKNACCFEPTIDYVVVKIPKWQFEKVPGRGQPLRDANEIVGESGHWRTFKEALQKGIRHSSLGTPWARPRRETPDSLLREEEKLATPTARPHPLLRPPGYRVCPGKKKFASGDEDRPVYPAK